MWVGIRLSIGLMATALTLAGATSIAVSQDSNQAEKTAITKSLAAAEQLAQGSAKGAAVTVANAGVDFWKANYAQNLPSWAKRIDFELKITENGKPQYGLETVQPLWQSPGRQDTVFIQGRLGNYYAFGESRLTSNLGVGYRKMLADNTVLTGINAFYDRDWKRNHERVSLGGEAKWNAFDLNINKYWGVSNWKNVGSGNKEKALDGYDAVLAMQVPYVPWARVRYKRSRWAVDTSGKSDINAWKAGLEFDLTQSLQLEASVSDDNYSNSLTQVQVRWLLGGAGDKLVAGNRLMDTHAFAMRDMRAYTLDKVQRTNRIVLKRQSSGVVIGRSD